MSRLVRKRVAHTHTHSCVTEDRGATTTRMPKLHKNKLLQNSLHCICMLRLVHINRGARKFTVFLRNHHIPIMIYMLAGWQPTQMIVNELWHSRAFTSSAARSYSLQYPTGVSVVVADLCFACFVAMVEVGPVWALLYRRNFPIDQTLDLRKGRLGSSLTMAKTPAKKSSTCTFMF